eukprot:gnl/Carplike_NY0171/2933_a3945_360.p1 GENE.gnl/Carplike_NY0171/2933_a3945_360~~gnl/Carplike_NY0171/2933_a3945_360.p1  ORF type:complete len:596 (+),score=109.22 gnl/Carplike_NY0171/2933_a3945_360:54-1841(+)
MLSFSRTSLSTISPQKPLFSSRRHMSSLRSIYDADQIDLPVFLGDLDMEILSFCIKFIETSNISTMFFQWSFNTYELHKQCNYILFATSIVCLQQLKLISPEMIQNIQKGVDVTISIDMGLYSGAASELECDKTVEISVLSLLKFFYLCEMNYTSCAKYHNNKHGASHLHTTALLLYLFRNHLISLSLDNCVFSQGDILCCLLAAASHDLRHPGLSQVFLIKNFHKIPAKFGTSSCLEFHHADVSTQLLQYCKLFNGKNFELVKRALFRLIMVTAMDVKYDFEGLLKSSNLNQVLTDLSVWQAFERSKQILSKDRSAIGSKSQCILHVDDTKPASCGIFSKEVPILESIPTSDLGKISAGPSQSLPIRGDDIHEVSMSEIPDNSVCSTLESSISEAVLSSCSMTHQSSEDLIRQDSLDSISISSSSSVICELSSMPLSSRSSLSVSPFDSPRSLSSVFTSRSTLISVVSIIFVKLADISGPILDVNVCELDGIGVVLEMEEETKGTMTIPGAPRAGRDYLSDSKIEMVSSQIPAAYGNSIELMKKTAKLECGFIDFVVQPFFSSIVDNYPWLLGDLGLHGTISIKKCKHYFSKMR